MDVYIFFQEETQGHRNIWISAENQILKVSDYSVLQGPFQVISFVVKAN